jgi:tellurium resistance protein TerD
MAISLQKGQKVDLTKTNPGLTKVVAGLGWDTNKYDGQSSFDLDASAFLLTAEGKVVSEKDFVFYGNPSGGNGSVIHSGDNRTGQGDGDDEQININLSAIPQEVEKVAFTITIHEGDVRNQNFGQVSNSFVRIFNEDNQQELTRYDLSEDFSIETAIVVGELYRHGGEWKFSAVGSGYQGGLAALCKSFGLEIA